MKRKIQGNARGKEKNDNLEKTKLSVEGELKPVGQNRRIGGGGFSGNCFRCSEEQHRSFECPHCRKDSIVNEAVVQDIQPELGESMLAWHVLVGQRILDSCQMTSLLRTCCKSGGKVCKVIVDGGSIDNLVVEEMDQKLG